MRSARLIATLAGSACAITAVHAQQIAVPPVPSKPAPLQAPDARGVEVLPDDKGSSPSLLVTGSAAGRVFEGVLVRKVTFTPPGMRVLVTEYEFQPHEWFKGARTPTVIVRETGGQEADGSGMYATNSHKLAQGGRYLVFLDQNADNVLFPFMRILQVFDSGAKVADETGRIVIGLREGVAVTRLDPEVPSMNYLGTLPRQRPRDVGPPTINSEPLPPQPQPPVTADHGPIPAEDIFKLLRPQGATPPADPQPAGLSTSALGGPDWNWCGYVTGSINLACFLPDNNNWAWYNDAAFDWDTDTNYSGSGGWIFGFATSGGNPIRNEAPVANNGRNNGAVPSDAQMIAGGYGSWAANLNPNGICFVWYTGGSCTRIRETDIFTNPSNQFNELQFRKSVVHEMGHALGLGHEDRYLADMVSGTWRLVPNYSSNFYLRTDDHQGTRSMLGWANTNAGAAWSLASFRDISTFAQTHPSPGVSADVGPYVTTLSTFFANTNQTIQIQRMHVENRGTAAYGGAVTLRVYLSTDTNITTGDYLVYSGGWPNYPGEGTSYNFNLNITIPPAVPSGNYYVGWIVSSGEAQLTGGNDTALMVRDSSGSFAARTLAITNTTPANDNCFSAFNVGVGTYFGATTSASTDGSTTCGPTPVGGAAPDVWYSFTAPCNGTLFADTCGSNYDTVLSVHTGCPGGTANSIACDDDGGNCGALPHRQSSLSAAVTAGSTYYVRVAGYSGATGNYQLNLGFSAAVPSNDLCSSAIAVGNGTTTGSTICAGTDGDTTCGTSNASPDVWYVYTPVLPGTLHVDTCGSSYDTVISVHTACPGTAANSIGCDDDGCSYPYSSLDVPVAGGQPYYIRVSGYNGSYGNFTLHTSFAPINDDCSNPLTITNGSTPFTNIGAITDGPTEPNCNFCCGDPQVNNDVWFRYTATCTGTATANLCDADYDSKIVIYQGSACPTSPGTAIACNDDFCGSVGLSSQVTWSTVSGTTYLLRVGGYLNNTGQGTIVLSCTGVAPCYANCDQSTNPPILNVNDFTCFLNKYAAGDSYANCDQSTIAPVLNVNDFSCFLNKYAIGCP